MPQLSTATPPLAGLLKAWRQSDCPDRVADGWRESAATRPPGKPDFLEPQQIEECRVFAGLGTEFEPMLQETASRIAADLGLAAFAWHTYRRAYIDSETVTFDSWPELEQPLGRNARILYVILALASIPLMRRRHTALGIPEQIARDTASDVVASIRRGALSRPDLPGLAPRELDWFQHHANASVFRIGRLQYRFRPFDGAIRIFRNPGSGETAAIAEPGGFFDSHGYRVPKPENRLATEELWESRLEETKDGIVANPVSPEGIVLRDQQLLPWSEWQLLVAPGDPVFEVHIPAGGGLTLAQCRQSMREAVAFHARHFAADPQPRIFSCMTWFLGPQLREILPETANILQFQRAVYLFPIETRTNEGFYFIFGKDELPDRLPENATGLQTSIYQYVRAGNPWRGGGMFFPAKDVDSFGNARSPWFKFQSKTNDR